MRSLFCLAALAGVSSICHAQVFLNEIFLNPPGSLDDTVEFVELMGTPGMKLDGFAIAVVSGTETEYYPLGSIPPIPALHPEIDEFFSLDGLSLGNNGLLVIGIGNSANYPTLLADTRFQSWTTIWNGNPADPPGKISNDGSNTFLLVRNRRGATQADPNDPLGVLWGKDKALPDSELITPVVDPADGITKDQFGDGSIDKGAPDNMGGNTTDLRGASTLADASDDLEVVDELSYEHTGGWEYDLDDRHVDVGSTSGKFPPRRVHALDDPNGINPDALARVDYRTKGNGWPAQGGGAGELANGNNWQDTATEQWIRGESLVGSGGQGGNPQLFFDNTANADPDAVQPYNTHVPLWLDDASAPDYNFTAANTYQIMAGRINPLAIAFIPGDVDRDGDCDASDISKLSAVFGDDDWLFSNSFADAPEGDSGDPATQTRPWDVNGTGDNGIECSDLQWVLNFQGDTTGRIVGMRYDSTTPSATGVYLNSNASVACTVTTSTSVNTGHALDDLSVGDLIQLTVRAQVTSGANNTAGQQNGVMQFVHDLETDAGDVVRVISVAPAAPFAKSRASLESLQGASGDRGVRNINGYATSFTQGLSGAASLYVVTLEAIGLGSTDITVYQAPEAKFAASTPQGLKVGHTNDNGNPASVAYPSAITVTVTTASSCVPCDTNCDGSVNGFDIDPLVELLTGSGTPCSPCAGDVNGDGSVNGFDIDGFVAALTGGGC
ncbi:MAG: hypothetical protein CHACPFDD_01843 [Phycisphaerae bacterium]|nr:hypothetical protein [Phycisphaerae bacterium]